MTKPDGADSVDRLEQVICKALYGVPTQELDAGKVTKFIGIADKLKPSLQQYIDEAVLTARIDESSRYVDTDWTYADLRVEALTAELQQLKT